jgi:hypothetical protein
LQQPGHFQRVDFGVEKRFLNGNFAHQDSTFSNVRNKWSQTLSSRFNFNSIFTLMRFVKIKRVDVGRGRR